MIEIRECGYEIYRKTPNDNDCYWSFRNFFVSYFCKIFYSTFGSNGSISSAIDGSINDACGSWKKASTTRIHDIREKECMVKLCKRNFFGHSFCVMV